MKLFDDDLQAGQVGHFAFSGVRPEKLGATEYTLVTLVTDKTGSVSGFEHELLAAKQAVVEACRRSPRANYLLLRNVEFNNNVDEVHGFVELGQIDPGQYTPPVCQGVTALFDATYSSVAATNEYARTLADNEFNVNAIVFVVTDGDNNVPGATPRMIAEELKRGVQNEWLESVMVLLIGVNAARYQAKLEAFRTEAGLTHYLDIGEATPERLARLAEFVSRSISSQSQSLGTGGPSQVLTF